MSMNLKIVSKICENCKKEFEIDSGDLDLYEKVGIELPTLCFFCRTKHLFAFWAFGKFRKGKSDLSGENLITVLPEKTRYPIYTLREWHSDKWDPMNFGREYDPNQSFFEQLKALQEKIPRPHQNGTKNADCDWSDDIWNSRNCYLCRSMKDCEYT